METFVWLKYGANAGVTIRERSRGHNAPRPIYVHCRTGADRTALVIALYRVRHGVPPDEARAEMVRRGFRPYPGLVRTWQRLVGPYLGAR